MRVRGIEIFNTRRPQKSKKEVPHKVHKKPVESAAPTVPSAANGVKPPPPLTTRQRRSAQRLEVFLEKKRVAAVQELVARNYDAVVARGVVERCELKRLERLRAERAAPMAAEPVIEGPPQGDRQGEQEGQERDPHAYPKRARVSGHPRSG